ncbi:MAG: DUF4041 domain-containing protein [Leptotrichiaceae bacterium]|jgi:hypothetical protein|nr:DUF4041 domain-containing protein [Leptotrichiaceae bacterium]MBP7026557.1 DUF4041 domain-containing protein [Leptotrichiaceae bacterium]MBP9876118.1 DUF4041 domain-containing protein [Leptotrichiaceae bacterium]
MTGKILKNVVIGILGLVAVSLMTKGGFYMVVGFLLIALLLFKNYLDGKTKKEMDSLIETANKVLTTEQMDYIDLKNESDTLSANIANYSKEKANLEMELALLKEKVKSESKQLLSLTDELEMESFALYKPRYNFSDALGYKDKLDEIRLKQQKMIKSKTAVNYSKDWTVDGSKAKGTKMTNDNIKQIIRCFNADCEAAINKIKFNNIQTIENRIYRSFEQLNKLNSTNRVSITNEFLNLKLQELYLGHEYEEKRQEEKEILREEREKEKEEKKLQKEIEDKKKIINKEINHYHNILSELELKLLDSPEGEKSDLQKQIEEIKNKLEIYNDEKEELDYRLENIGAGYVYIISNIGSFGENIYKIGVTRRLEPEERINELSSASLPFKFDIHAMIFSYQAYDLEKHLHNTFNDKRINLVNSRKEFFNITIEEIEEKLKEYKDLTVEFNKVPSAEEYRETEKIKNSNT